MLRSEEHTSELQSRRDLVCRLLLEKKKRKRQRAPPNQKTKTLQPCNLPKFGDHRYLHSYPTLRSSDSEVDRMSLRSFFFFNDTATTEISTLSLHDALPI